MCACVCRVYYTVTLLWRSCFPGDKRGDKGEHRVPEGESGTLRRLPLPERGPQQEVPQEGAAAQEGLVERGIVGENHQPCAGVMLIS